MKRALILILVLGAALPGVASASCIPLTPAQQRARADVIFDGVALEGPTTSGVQRFRVRHYLKGAGPRLLRVTTGETRHIDGTETVTSVSIHVERGERWRIFVRASVRRVLRTSLCDGSKRFARR